MANEQETAPDKTFKEKRSNALCDTDEDRNKYDTKILIPHKKMTTLKKGILISEKMQYATGIISYHEMTNKLLSSDPIYSSQTFVPGSMC